jgi:hypothetical protein
MMETVSTSETSLSFYQTTRHNIPEDSHLHTHRREMNFEVLIYVFSSSFSVYEMREVDSLQRKTLPSTPPNPYDSLFFNPFPEYDKPPRHLAVAPILSS